MLEQDVAFGFGRKEYNGNCCVTSGFVEQFLVTLRLLQFSEAEQELAFAA